MVTNREEQLNRYFEHVMSPAEEQSFLITVAASDEMRIAFRSQLELMKAVRSDKDSLRSVAQVRSRTLTALGLSATAVTPFIEHELLRGAKQEAQMESASLADEALPIGWMSRISSLIRQPIIALTGGLALGILSTTAVMRQIESNANVTPITQSVPQPATSPTSVQTNGKTAETISPLNGLNNSGSSQPVASRHLGEGGRMINHNSANVGVSAASSTIPVTNRIDPVTIHSKKPTIINENDSTATK